MVNNSNGKLYKANEGVNGDFKTLIPGNTSERSKSTIRMIVNEGIDVTKVFDNLVFNTNSYDENDVYQSEDMFDTITVSNDIQSTNEKEIVLDNQYPILTSGQVQCKFLNNEYRLSTPRDNSSSRIKSKYAIIDLTYNNQANYKFVVNYIKTLFRVNRR